MSGTKNLLNTNALINFLQGDTALKKFSDLQVSFSIITLIEILSFPGITEKDKALCKALTNTLLIIDLKKDDTALIEKTIELRSSLKIKLPDAIIAATAITSNAILVTNDKDFLKVNSLSIKSF